MASVDTAGGSNGVDFPSGAPWTNISGSPFSLTASGTASFVVPADGILAISCDTASRTHIRISDDATLAAVSDLYLNPANVVHRMPVQKGWTVSLRNDPTLGTSITRAALLKNIGE